MEAWLDKEAMTPVGLVSTAPHPDKSGFLDEIGTDRSGLETAPTKRGERVER